MKVTRKWLEDKIKDEEKDAKMYDKYGFHSIASDERRHARMLRSVLSEMFRKKHKRFSGEPVPERGRLWTGGEIGETISRYARREKR